MQPTSRAYPIYGDRNGIKIALIANIEIPCRGATIELKLCFGPILEDKFRQAKRQLTNLDQLAANLVSEFSVIDQSIAPTDQGLFQFATQLTAVRGIVGSQLANNGDSTIHPAAADQIHGGGRWDHADGLRGGRSILKRKPKPHGEILNAMVRLLSEVMLRGHHRFKAELPLSPAMSMNGIPIQPIIGNLISFEDDAQAER